MKAQCCICADLFENDEKVNIAAAPCGHVFHEACLMRWMNSSSTCPSCRTHVKKAQIIKRLFFDISEDADEEEDVGHYKNKINDLRAQVNEKEKSRREAVESRDKLEAVLSVSESKSQELTAKLSREKSMRDVLQSDLERIQKENYWHVQEISELQKKEKKLQELQNLETVLKGSCSDVDSMLRQYSEGGETSIRQLVSLVTVVKKEYNQVLADKRAAKEQLSKLKQLIGAYQAEAKHAKLELVNLREELEVTSKNLSVKEAENNDNRRKIVHLRNALHRNKTQGSQSFHEALTEDSPNVAYTPVTQLQKRHQLVTPTTPTRAKPSTIVNKATGADENCVTPPPTQKRMCLSPDLFDTTPAKHETGTSAECDNSTAEDDAASRFAKPVKRKKTAYADVDAEEQSETSIKQQRSMDSSKKSYDVAGHEEEDDGPHIPPAMLSIMHRKMSGLATSSHTKSSKSHSGSVITRGFDGFGGSTSFVHPTGPPRGSLMRFAQQKKVKKNSNIQRQPVPKSQRHIIDCMQAVSSSTTSSSSSSSSSSTSSSMSSSSSSSKLSFPPKPHRTILGMFASKGSSLSSSKAISNKEKGFIDLTGL